MRYLLTLSFLCGSVADGAPLSITEVRTASDTVLVAYVKSPNASGPVWDRVIQANEVKTDDPSAWKLNGQPVAAIHKFVTPADACDHHLYLQTSKLVPGKAYTLETPHGSKEFVFDDKRILCESIKVNQNAYSALSKVRYANFAIWLGTGGSQQISGALPAYTVFKQFTGEQVAQGTLQQIGQDESSGDFVYRIDLSGVPEGGPYRISVKGYGCSYPFGVGADFSRCLGHVAFRSLYYQRCGCPIVEPYARANIRPKPCHTLIYDTLSRSVEANVKVNGTEPPMTVHGGYHDAGDADRRPYHLMVPVVLLTTVEVFPSVFTDDQFNIPDKFDANFNILGKGNGIPDILDEASWGTMFWEHMQTATGAVRGGTETTGYPDWGISFDQDAKRYGTLMADDRATGLAAGLFMNLARALKPFNPKRCAELQKRGDMAFDAVGDRIRPAHKLYYAIQKYLLTGDEAAHVMVKSLAPATSSFQASYCNEAGGFLSDGNYWLASFFMSYLVEKARPTDPAVVKQLAASLKAAADKEIEFLGGTAYPVGWPADLDLKKHNWNQGSFTAQGQLAYPCLMQWALTKEQKYLDAASQLMDYVQGLNPIGKCYVSGVGFDSVHHPHDRESTYAQDKGWGPRPGIVVYGPVLTCAAEQVPAAKGLARERRYVDHLGSYQMNEFTVYQSLVFPASIYPVLARGGKWDPAKDPFASQQK
jgi:endoglucanase